MSKTQKAKYVHKWTLELILMRLLLEMNRWHFKNSLCLQFTVKIKPHHHFQHWQWDSSAWVFLGWQTPALIQAWMMSSIHYTMIKSLPPTPRPSVTSLLWTRHSSRAPTRLFLARRWVLRDWGQGGVSLPHSQAAPESGAWWVKTQWPVRRPVTHDGPAVAVAREAMKKGNLLPQSDYRLKLKYVVGLYERVGSPK